MDNKHSFTHSSTQIVTKALTHSLWLSDSFSYCRWPTRILSHPSGSFFSPHTAWINVFLSLSLFFRNWSQSNSSDIYLFWESIVFFTCLIIISAFSNISVSPSSSSLSYINTHKNSLFSFAQQIQDHLWKMKTHKIILNLFMSAPSFSFSFIIIC